MDRHRAPDRAPAARPLYVTPSGLALYRACPQKFSLARLRRHPAGEGFSPALERGRAVHVALADCAAARRGGRPVPADLAARVAAALPRERYPDPRAWAEESAAAVAQVRAGLPYLGRRGRIAAIERSYRWTYPGDAACPAFTLAAVADLVTVAEDDEGRAYATVTDWKTAARKGIDLLQEAILRIVVGHALGDAVAYVVSETVHLADGSASAIIRSESAVREVWRDLIKPAVGALAADTTWAPNPDSHCAWCDYRGHGCVLDAADTAGDMTARWLDAGDADGAGGA